MGVDGELKAIAMKALNTRANFAYSQKEVRTCAAGVAGHCCWRWAEVSLSAQVLAS